MTYTIRISYWYNLGGTEPCALAIPEAPELGSDPHAQEVMRYYGISYAKSVPRPITDDWIFYGCDKHPPNIPQWMLVLDEETGAKIAKDAAP